MANNYQVRDGNGQFVTKASVQQTDGSQADFSAVSSDIAAKSTPVTGSTTTSTTVGPFTPQLGRDIRVVVTMTGTGTAQLFGSFDGGATKLPLTVGGQLWGSYTAAMNETVWTPTVAGETFYLAITATGGTTTGTMMQ